MPTEKLQKPTATELEILRVLWERGPSTVREVHEVLALGKPIGYTTVLKIMQIMTQKGSVARNEDSKAHVYKARQPAENTKRQLVGDLLTRAFARLSESVDDACSGGQENLAGRNYGNSRTVRRI